MKDNNTKPATLKDIASEAGISPSAVSKALNGTGNISEDTIARVRQIAKKLNYSPNVIARSLRSNNSKTIGVIVADSYTAFFPNIVKGIGEAAGNYGYSMILSITNNDKLKEKEALELFSSKRVDGILLLSSTLTSEEELKYIEKFGVPFVFLVRRSVSPSANCIINDYEWGAYIATKHLLRVAGAPVYFLNVSKHIPCSEDMFHGYSRALSEAGVKFDETWLEYVWTDINDGYLHMRKILDSGKNKGAVLCGNDEIAIGAMEAIFTKALRIPEDFHIAGYDDIDYAGYLRVPLTSVSQPKYNLGYQGMELLHNNITAGNSGKPQKIVLKPELIIRQST